MRWRLEALLYDLVGFILRLFPFAWISAFGGVLFTWLGPLTSKQKIVKTGLRTAFPEKSEAEIHALARAQWNNTGRTFSEFMLTHRLKHFSKKSRVQVVNLEVFNTNAPVVIFSGHFANWEIMASLLTQLDKPVKTTYRKINNPYIDARIRKQRKAYGDNVLIPKSGANGSRKLLRALKDGDSVALMNDQKFNTGVEVPFFGQPAMTAPGAVRLALKTGCPLMPVAITRHKSRFTVTFFEPIPLVKTGERDTDVKAGVLQINQFIEARIRENPDQWFWSHRRWPKSLYK